MTLYGLIKLIPEFAAEGSLFQSKHNFTIHLLKDKTVYISFLVDKTNEPEMILLDKFTSSVLKRGGTI